MACHLGRLGRRIAWVEPSPSQGRTRWVGSARSLGFPLCRAVRGVLAGVDPGVTLSRRARTRLAEIREELPFCGDGYTSLVTDDEAVTRWWTFAGFGANAVLAQMLAKAGAAVKRLDNFSITLAQEPGEGLPAMLAASPLTNRRRRGSHGWIKSNSSSRSVYPRRSPRRPWSRV